MEIWNPWHGCRRYSEGCAHCYMFRRDEQVGRDATAIYRTRAFDLPVRRGRDGDYKMPLGATIFACMTSDFFLEEADDWRAEAWRMIALRPDVRFTIITKRIARAEACLPPDWGAGYPHVTIGCTIENQRQNDLRLRAFRAFPALHKLVICEPLLSSIRFGAEFGDWVECAYVGGESGPGSRACDYAWVLDIRAQCIERGVPFVFRQTGAHFVKDGRSYTIPRAEQSRQARRAQIDWMPG